MPETKRCPNCTQFKPRNDFYADQRMNSGRKTWCKECTHQYTKDRRHRLGIQRPMSEAKECSQYLGVYIAERALSRFFNNIHRMPMNNPGYDFICGKGFRIDVKSSCLHTISTQYSRWMFDIKRNSAADYFLCLAFGDRDSLEPLHVWLIPGNKINHLAVLSISSNPKIIKKWGDVEHSLTKVSACCEEMKIQSPQS